VSDNDVVEQQVKGLSREKLASLIARIRETNPGGYQRMVEILGSRPVVGS
jgi:hypothetical protein